MSENTGEALQALWAQMGEDPVYVHYAQALQVADTAGPKEIPKADGMLLHAEAMLVQALAARGVTHTAGAMNFLKAKARAAYGLQ